METQRPIIGNLYRVYRDIYDNGGKYGLILYDKGYDKNFILPIRDIVMYLGIKNKRLESEVEHSVLYMGRVYYFWHMIKLSKIVFEEAC